MRRRARLQRLQQKAKLALSLLWRQADGPEHVPLHLGLVDAQAAACKQPRPAQPWSARQIVPSPEQSAGRGRTPNLKAVQDHVVGPGAGRGQVAAAVRALWEAGRREGVVQRLQACSLARLQKACLRPGASRNMGLPDLLHGGLWDC